ARRWTGDLPLGGADAALRSVLHEMVDAMSGHALAAIAYHAFHRARRDGDEAPLLRFFERAAETGATGAFLARARALPPERQVLFFARKPYFVIVREALALRKLGWRCLLAHVDAVPADLVAGLKAAFDDVVQVADHLLIVEGFVSRAPVALVHIQCGIFDFALSYAALRGAGSRRTIAEFYDMQCFAGSPALMATYFGRERAVLDRAVEGALCREADAVITRFDEAATPAVARHHGPIKRILKFWPHPSNEYLRYDDSYTPPQGRRPWRLVHVGGLPPKAPDGAIIGQGFLPAIERLAAQGAAIDFLHDPHRDFAKQDGAPEVLARAEHIPRFRIEPGLPPDRLASRLCSYDFGLLLNWMPPGWLKAPEEQRRYAVATKIFTYFEAGLPVLVNEELETMARLVRDHGLGVVVKSDDIPDLLPRLAQIDVVALRANVRRYNQLHNMDREIHHLDRLYRDLVGAV
ncbi:MAG TPA: hypothetical protein VGG33_26080, partial [Polyangia bacterium]